MTTKNGNFQSKIQMDIFFKKNLRWIFEGLPDKDFVWQTSFLAGFWQKANKAAK